MAEKNIETKKENILKIKKEDLKKILPFFGAIISFILAFGLAFTPVWQLSLFAGIIGGLFYIKMKHGCLIGLISVGLGWIFYIVIQISTSSVIETINQIAGIIIGNIKLGWLIIIIIIVIGFLLGALGGTLGSGIRKIIHLKTNKEKT